MTSDDAPEPSRKSLPRVIMFAYNLIDMPITWLRESVVLPLRQKPPIQYFHRRLNPVPTVDECEMDDEVCQEEANIQFRTNRLIDKEIVELLRHRWKRCKEFYRVDYYKACYKQMDDFYLAQTNFFTKYGDIGPRLLAVDALMKQKHRMIWQRRNPQHDISGLSDRDAWYEKTFSSLLDKYPELKQANLDVPDEHNESDHV